MKNRKAVVLIKDFDADLDHEEWAAELEKEIENISGNKKIISVSVAPYLIGSCMVIVLLENK